MAGGSVGAVYIDAILNSKGFSKQVESTAHGAQASFAGAFKKIASAIGIGLSVKAVYDFGKSCVQAAAQAESAFMGLNATLNAQGKSFQQANKFIKEYTADGLVGMTAAVQAYKNLAARGYNTEQIESVMVALKDSAAFGRASAYSYEEAIVSATEGLRQENSILVDNAGVTKNVAKMWEDYAASIGKTANQLTDAEKVQAEVSGILNETKFQMGDAARYADTFQGRMSRLGGTFGSIKTEIGNIVIPILDLFIPAIQAGANAILNFITRIKQLLAIFGLKMKEIGGGGGGAASAFDSTAQNASAAADAIESTGKAAGGAAKAIKRALMPYDELNKLQSQKDSGGGGGGGGGVGDDIAESAEVAYEITEETENALAAMSATAQKYLGIFAGAFSNAFGDTTFDGVTAHIESIGAKVKEIFSDPEVTNAGTNLAESIVAGFGAFTGAVARIGANIIEWLIGSVDYAITETQEDIKERIVRLFDGWSLSWDLAGSITTALGEISDVLASDEAKRLGGELLACFTISAGLLWQFAVDTANGVIGAVEKALQDNKGALKTAFIGLFEFGGDIAQPVREALQGIANAYDETYEEHLSPAFEKFSQGWSDFVAGFLEEWNKNGKPILDEIAQIWDEFVTSDLGPAFEELVEAGGKVIEMFGQLWSVFGGDAGKAAGEEAVGAIGIVRDFLRDTLKILGAVLDGVGASLEVLGGVAEFFTGLFSFDFKKMGDGLLSVAEGIGNLIDAVLELFDIDFDLTEWVSGLFGKGDDLTAAFKKPFENAWSGVTKSWGDKKLSVGSKFTTAKKDVDGWSKSVSSWWGNKKETVGTKFSGTKKEVQGWGKNVSSWWGKQTVNASAGIDTTKNKVTEWWNKVKGWWGSRKLSISNNLSTAKSTLTSWFSTLQKWWGTKKLTVALNFSAAVENLKTWLNTNVIKKINNALPSFMKKIPLLAQGGWLPANSPQLAVVGDNKREGEIVSPESKIREQVKLALSELGLGGGDGGTGRTDVIRLEIAMPNGRTIIKEINRAQMAAGKVLLLT